MRVSRSLFAGSMRMARPFLLSSRSVLPISVAGSSLLLCRSFASAPSVDYAAVRGVHKEILVEGKGETGKPGQVTKKKFF